MLALHNIPACERRIKWQRIQEGNCWINLAFGVSSRNPTTKSHTPYICSSPSAHFLMLPSIYSQSSRLGHLLVCDEQARTARPKSVHMISSDNVQAHWDHFHSFL